MARLRSSVRERGCRGKGGKKGRKKCFFLFAHGRKVASRGGADFERQKVAWEGQSAALRETAEALSARLEKARQVVVCCCVAFDVLCDDQHFCGVLSDASMTC